MEKMTRSKKLSGMMMGTSIKESVAKKKIEPLDLENVKNTRRRSRKIKTTLKKIADDYNHCNVTTRSANRNNGKREFAGDSGSDSINATVMDSPDEMETEYHNGELKENDVVVEHFHNLCSRDIPMKINLRRLEICCRSFNRLFVSPEHFSTKRPQRVQKTPERYKPY